MAIRILVADDHCMLRQSLCSVLEGVDGFRVVSEADNGLKAIALAEQHRPDVAVIDVEMPDLNGIETTHRIVEANASIKVLGLSMHCEMSYIDRMFQSGASGYIFKRGGVDELVQAIHTVARGDTYLSPRIAGLVVDKYVKPGQARKEGEAVNPLAPREREVLQMLSEGKSSKEIGFLLNISSKTVDTYRQKLMGKLGVSSIAELTKYAIREGITALG